MTPNYYTFAKLRWRGGISVLLLANFLLFASVEDCEAFLRRLGLEPFLIPSKEGGLLLRITDADKSDCLITLKAMLDYVDSEAWAGEKYEKNKITLCYPVRSDFLHLRVWREQIQKNTLVEKDLKQQIMQHVKQQSIQIPISDYYKSDWIKQKLSYIQHENEIQLDIFSDEFLFLNCANCPVDYLFYVESVVPFYHPTQQTNTLTDCPETLFEQLDEHKREGILKVILASLHHKNNNVKNIVLEHTNEVLDYLETETTKSSLSTTSSHNNNENGIGDEYHLDNSKGSIYHYLRKYIRSHHGGENTEIENHNNNNTILHLHSVTSDATINNNNDNEEVESDNSEARKTTEINFFLDDIMSNSLYKKIETELETKQRENEEKKKNNKVQSVIIIIIIIIIIIR
ncbi:hypothetical protein ADEAN_000815400 [Angomonas deanei]|uniref:Uncharacterized protein n=1 Tax=Angomonas deanei TaxID=59799 RepID=A0A7G2CR22_9TRYP|nr:hypothetical protein ADEAN_000815400 [Angomonas deanei]